MNEGSQNCNPADVATLQAPKVIAEKLGECKKQQCARKQGWPQIAEVHMKGMNSVSPKAYIFPYLEYQIS